MNATETILARLDASIAKGNTAVGDMHSSNGYYSEMAYEAYHSWHAQALSCVADVAGPDSEYHKNFALQTGKTGRMALRIGVGILSSLRDDVANGHMRRTADLVAAEVFSDFLEMAGYLVTAGYFVAAASLGGAVLEEGLRRLSAANQLKFASEDGISALNNRLAGRSIYSALVRKEVDLWGSIRNEADHGHFDQVKSGDVADMLSGVGRFLAEYVG
jgi:hypothetical protein